MVVLDRVWTVTVGERNRRAWTITIFVTMAAFGAAMMVRGPVVAELDDAFGAPEWQLGLVGPAAAGGFLLAMAATGFAAGRLRPRRLVAGTLAINGATMVALAVAPNLWVFLAAIVVQGATIGGARGINRPLLSHYYPTRRGRVYGYYDMTWAVGATLGPLLVIAVLAAGSWRYVFWLLAAVLFALAVRVWFLAAPTVESGEKAFERGDLRELLERPEILAMTLVMLCATSLEGGLFLWLPTYAGGELPAWLAGFALTLFVGAYVPGRFTWGRLAGRVGRLPLLVAVFATLLPTYLFTFLVADGRWVLLGIFLLGFLTSAVYPMLTAYATDAVPEFSGPVTAIAAVTASIGVGASPAILGFAASATSLAAALLLLVVPIVLALALCVWAWLAARRRSGARLATSGD